MTETIRHETVTFKGFTFEQDLTEGQQLCTTCKGRGLAVLRYPFFLNGDRMKDMTEYHRRWVGTCPDCFGGVQNVCTHCGGGYTQWIHHHCDGAKAAREAAYAERQRVKVEKATKLTEAEALAAGVPYLFSEGLDRYLSWDELADLDPEDLMEIGIVWACDETRMSLNAHDLIENACDDLHEEAAEDIPKEAMQELDAFLATWVEKYGHHTTTYSPDYQRVVLVEAPTEGEDQSHDEF